MRTGLVLPARTSTAQPRRHASSTLGRVFSVVVCNYFCVVFDVRRPTGALPGHAKCRKSFAPALALASAAACSASAALALASDFLTVASESCWASASASARAEARRDGGGAFEPAQAVASAVAWRFLLASVVLGSDGRCEGESSLEADARLPRPFMLPSEPSFLELRHGISGRCDARQCLGCAR